MSVIGTCGGCGGDLGNGSLRLTLEAGPGPRGQSGWSVNGSKLDRFDICAACLAGERAAGTILTKMLDDEFSHGLPPASKHCTIACRRPRHRTPILLNRRRAADFENSHCPVCFGPADVTEAPGAQPVRRRLRDKLRNRIPAREPWPARPPADEDSNA
jgi:hypothetical protein